MQRISLKNIAVAALVLGLVVTAGFAYLLIPKAIILARVQDPRLAVPGEITDTEEYAVYSAIIASQFMDASTELVLVENQASLMGLDLPSTKLWGLQVSEELLNDFSAKNQASSKIGNAFTLSKPYLLVKGTEMVVTNLELWNAHIEYTPFLTFSRVGFSPDKNAALVHLSVAMFSRSLRPYEFAYGQYYLLQKVEGHWTIQGQQDTFIT